VLSNQPIGRAVHPCVRDHHSRACASRAAGSTAAEAVAFAAITQDKSGIFGQQLSRVAYRLSLFGCDLSELTYGRPALPTMDGRFFVGTDNKREPDRFPGPAPSLGGKKISERDGSGAPRSGISTLRLSEPLTRKPPPGFAAGAGGWRGSGGADRQAPCAITYGTREPQQRLCGVRSLPQTARTQKTTCDRGIGHPPALTSANSTAVPIGRPFCCRAMRKCANSNDRCETKRSHEPNRHFGLVCPSRRLIREGGEGRRDLASSHFGGVRWGKCEVRQVAASLRIAPQIDHIAAAPRRAYRFSRSRFAAQEMAEAYRRPLSRDAHTGDGQEQQPGPFRDRGRFTR
jgi:hypothetical protein